MPPAFINNVKDGGGRLKADKKIFFEKKQQKVLQVRKNVLPLHPQSREMHLLRGGKHAEIAQLVEHNLAKVGVAGPSPVFRST